MANPMILVLGHSFIRRLEHFVGANPNLDHQFLLGNVGIFKWHGVGGRTAAKTMRYDLMTMRYNVFAPDIVILQLGTNDLSQVDPLVAGSAIEELVTVLHESHNVKLICVCQTLPDLRRLNIHTIVCKGFKRSSPSEQHHNFRQYKIKSFSKP